MHRGDERAKLFDEGIVLRGGGDSLLSDAEGNRRGVAAQDLRRSRAEIEREVRVDLEDAELARRGAADAARGEVRDRPRRKGEPHARQVDSLRRDGNADRVDGGGHLPHEAKHEVEVVDHEIEHDVHLGAARIEAREAVGLHETRRAHPLRDGQDRAVPPLDVADGEHEIRFPRRLREATARRRRRGERLLHEEVALRGEAGEPDLLVSIRGSGHHHRVAPFEEALQLGREEDAAGSFGASRGAHVHDAGENGALDSLEAAHVVPAHLPEADDADADGAHGPVSGRCRGPTPR